MAEPRIAVLGSFVADLAFRTADLPGWGETIMGREFRFGPGGKGSNQAVAAARLGANVAFISKIGCDAFGQLAKKTYEDEKIDTRYVFESSEFATGAASIVVHETNGENSIVVVPGAGFELTEAEVDRAAGSIRDAAILLAQLETRLATVEHGLKLAKQLGVPTILNPAPAHKLPDSVFPLCDYLTPNESETAALTGLEVRDIESAKRAASSLLARGTKNVVLTLGATGALVMNAKVCEHVPAVDAGPVVETTGAGDAFNAGFAVALAEGRDIVNATRFGCAVAGISVTRHGTALAMPRRDEVDSLLKRALAAE